MVHLCCLCLARPSTVLKANDSFSVKAPLLPQVHLPPLQLGHSTVLSLIMSCLVLSLVGAKILTSHWSPGSTHEWDWNCEGGLNAQGKWNSRSEIETDTQSSRQRPEKPAAFCNRPPTGKDDTHHVGGQSPPAQESHLKHSLSNSNAPSSHAALFHFILFRRGLPMQPKLALNLQPSYLFSARCSTSNVYVRLFMGKSNGWGWHLRL